MRKMIKKGLILACSALLVLTGCSGGSNSSSSSEETKIAADQETTEAAVTETTEAAVTETAEAAVTESAATETTETAVTETAEETNNTDVNETVESTSEPVSEETDTTEPMNETTAETSAQAEETVDIELADGQAAAIFYLDDGSVYLAEAYTDGGRVTKPDDPAPEDGRSFVGWYADADLTTEYNFVARQSGEQKIYARFSSGYVFEAEYTQLTGREVDSSTDGSGNLYGSGYSNEPKGLQLVSNDKDRPADSENGYYLHDLYRNGLYIEFVITSDREVDDATLTLRLAGEYYTSTLTDENFYVSVRPEGADPYDESVTSYFEFDDITFTLENSGDYAAIGTFRDYRITTSMHLDEGVNIIRLEVANTEHHGAGGTINATAPMIDCITIDTDAVLTWEPVESNVK